jgi:hypothetical protein
MSLREWDRNRNAERLAEAVARGVKPGTEQRLWVTLFANDGVEERLAEAGWVVHGREPNESGWTSIYTDYCYHLSGTVIMSEESINAMTLTLLEIAGPEGEVSWAMMVAE